MSNNNDRILDMYTVLINQVYLSHTRFLETVNFLEQGVRQIHNSNNNTHRNYNNSPRNNRSNIRNNQPRYNNNNINNNNNLNRSTFRNVDYLYNNQNRVNRMTPNYRHQRGFPETSGISELFSNILSNQTEFNINNLSPVVIRPTQQQISNATEEINVEQTNYVTCPITQDRFEENSNILRIIHCQHCFSRDPLLNWFERSVLCPVCRYDIRDFSNNNISSTTNDLSNNSIPFQRTTSTESNTSQNSNMEDFLNTFTSQISETLTQHIINNDISLNNLDNRAVNLEYTIQTPNNVFTISSMSPDSIGTMMQRLQNNNNNNNNTETNN